MSSSILTLAIVLIYLIGISAIIIWTGKHVHSYYDFALNGGALPWYVAAGTMFASMIGGATMIGYVGSFKAYGLQWMWLPLLGFSLSPILIGIFLAGRIKNLNQYTNADIFKIRYGKKAAVIAAVISCLGEIAVVASMMASFRTMVNGYLGIDKNVAILLAIVIFYITATKGGLGGVAWTDAIQTIVILVTVLIVTVICFGNIQDAGGFSALPANLINPFAENIPWLTMSGNIVSGALLCTVSQCLIIQRINACKSGREARKATILSGAMTALFMIFFIGVIGLSAYFTTAPEVAGNDVITTVMSTMPTVLGALYAAAILAAVLTTANSMLLSCSMSFVHDIIGSRKTLDDRQALRYSRIFILIIDLLSAVCILFASGVLTWILIDYTILATLCIPLYGGLLSKKSTPASGVLSLLLGCGGAAVYEILKMYQVLPAPFSSVHSVFPGLILGLVGLLIGRLIGSSTPRQLAVVDCFRENKPYQAEASK